MPFTQAKGDYQVLHCSGLVGGVLGDGDFDFDSGVDVDGGLRAKIEQVRRQPARAPCEGEDAKITQVGIPQHDRNNVVRSMWLWSAVSVLIMRYCTCAKYTSTQRLRKKHTREPPTQM